MRRGAIFVLLFLDSGLFAGVPGEKLLVVFDEHAFPHADVLFGEDAAAIGLGPDPVGFGDGEWVQVVAVVGLFGADGESGGGCGGQVRGEGVVKGSDGTGNGVIRGNGGVDAAWTDGGVRGGARLEGVPS